MGYIHILCVTKNAYAFFAALSMRRMKFSKYNLMDSNEFSNLIVPENSRNLYNSEKIYAYVLHTGLIVRIM